jgi:hypothetical protein
MMDVDEWTAMNATVTAAMREHVMPFVVRRQDLPDRLS